MGYIYLKPTGFKSDFFLSNVCQLFMPLSHQVDVPNADKNFFVVFTDANMLIKTKINNDQKYVKISEPSLEEFLSSGKASDNRNERKLLPAYDSNVILKRVKFFL